MAANFSLFECSQTAKIGGSGISLFFSLSQGLELVQGSPPGWVCRKHLPVKRAEETRTRPRLVLLYLKSIPDDPVSDFVL